MRKTLLCAALLFTSCVRPLYMADDVSPCNRSRTQLDWHYGSKDIQIQTARILSNLMERWYWKTGYNPNYYLKPRLIITEVDNCTDQYLSNEMIRDIFENVAASDGRFAVVVGNTDDTSELDSLMKRILNDPKYANSSRIKPNSALAPQFLVKVRITKANNFAPSYLYEDYRMTVTLYDIETQTVVDSAQDLLRKRVRMR